MIAPFLDYDTITYNLQNGQQVFYSVPYDSLIYIGQIELDETFNFVAEFQQNMQQIGNGPNGFVTVGGYASFDPHDNVGGEPTTINTGSLSAIMKQGDRVRLDSADETNVTLHIFRLPTSP